MFCNYKKKKLIQIALSVALREFPGHNDAKATY